MFLLRFFALILIVASLMTLGSDLFAMLEAGGSGFLQHTHSLEEIWGLVHPGSLDAIAGDGSPLPEGLVGTVLGLPASLTLGGVGFVLAILFRSRD